MNLDRCFWEEHTTRVSIFKNEELLEHFSVTLTVGLYLQAPYGFWRYTNNMTGKESVFLNTATNNFLEGTNYNYSCTPLNNPGGCRQNYAMPTINTANSMTNILSCSTIVSLKAEDLHPVTHFCQAVKLIKNLEAGSIGIKSLSGSCDIKIQDKTKLVSYITVDEGSYRFFGDFM
jgi:hypothetical protein